MSTCFSCFLLCVSQLAVDCKVCGAVAFACTLATRVVDGHRFRTMYYYDKCLKGLSDKSKVH